jgi:kumamolisin
VPRLSRLAAAGCLAASLAAVAPAGAAAQSGSGSGSKASGADLILELHHSPGFHRFVRGVSDPTSPTYRQYRSVNALAKQFGASPKAKQRALSYLDAHGIEGEVAATGTFITASGTRAQIAEAFGAAGARSAGPSTDPTPPVPAKLRGAVDAVTVAGDEPVVEPHAGLRQAAQPTPASARPRTGTPAGCPEGVASGGFTPNQVLTAYGHKALHEQGITGKGVRVAVIEIDGFDPKDVAAYAQCFGVKVPPITRKAVGTPGNKLLAPGPETTLDLQVLATAAPGLESIDVYEGGASTEGILASVSEAIGGKPAIAPDVISISLGGCEANDALDSGYARALNELFALAAGAGISVFVSSGDSGATPCQNGNQGPVPVFSVEFPASSQYVTAVGGTNITLSAANRLTGQLVWNESADGSWGAGGGGFSNLFGRPWYQRTLAAPSVEANTTRMVPDIAALADTKPGYAYFCTNQECQEELKFVGWGTVGGTSAAAPLMAAGAALANEAARKAGQPRLGFVNPLIYTLGTSKGSSRVLSDVTVGSNDVGVLITPPNGTGAPLGVFSAAKGFDAVTGWGSPKVAAFAKAALAAGR